MEVPELIDEFVGGWVLADLWRGASQVELATAGPTRLTFHEDGTGEFRFAGVDAAMECRYGETLEGLPMVQFEWNGRADDAAARGSGFALLRFESDEIEGEVMVGSQSEVTFGARRERPRSGRS